MNKFYSINGNGTISNGIKYYVHWVKADNGVDMSGLGTFSSFNDATASGVFENNFSATSVRLVLGGGYTELFMDSFDISRASAPAGINAYYSFELLPITPGPGESSLNYDRGKISSK